MRAPGRREDAERLAALAGLMGQARVFVGLGDNGRLFEAMERAIPDQSEQVNRILLGSNARSDAEDQQQTGPHIEYANMPYYFTTSIAHARDDSCSIIKQALHPYDPGLPPQSGSWTHDRQPGKWRGCDPSNARAIGVVDGVMSPSRYVWSAAELQAKTENDSLVCAYVFDL
jgi:hypothetical protein